MLENDLLELIAAWRKEANVDLSEFRGVDRLMVIKSKTQLEYCANQLEAILNKAKDRKDALKRHTQLLEAEGFYD